MTGFFLKSLKLGRVRLEEGAGKVGVVEIFLDIRDVFVQ